MKHVATGVDFSARPNVDTRIRDAYGAKEFYRKFIDAAEGLDIPPANIKFMNEIIEFSHRRAHMLEKRSLLRTVMFVMLNMKYYPTLRNALSDIYAMIFLK